MSLFNKNEIWAFPTDTSFGLGVRADDLEGLKKLYELKQRPSGKFFSLMVSDWEMLKIYAEVPKRICDTDFFTKRPRTAILKSTRNLPKTKYWPSEKVAFRICTIPKLVNEIEYPITATSANFSGEEPIFDILVLQKKFGNQIKIYDKMKKLPRNSPSEIWDFTAKKEKQLR